MIEQTTSLVPELKTARRTEMQRWLSGALLAVFVFVSANPLPALAFSEQTELSWKPLAFERDEKLKDVAVSGLHALPGFKISGGQEADFSIPAEMEMKSGLTTRVLITSYSSTSDQTDGNPDITASGSRVHSGVLAANWLPFGTVVAIGDGTYTVEDRMNQRYDGQLIVDIWHSSRESAQACGIRTGELKIVTIPEST